MSIGTQMLPGGAQARLRVIASDGFNTAIAVTPPFSIAKHAPQVFIDGVAENERLEFGVTRQLQGLLLDAETGTTGAHFDWNLTGPTPRIGTGDFISLSGLSPGAYTATLIGIDPDGQDGMVTRQFEVLPPTVPDGPSAELDGYGNDDGYQNGAYFQVPAEDGGYITARMFHADGYLHIAFSDLRVSMGGPARSVGVRIDANNSRDQAAAAGDIGLFIDQDGIPYQQFASNGVMTTTLSPQQGFSALIYRAPTAWSAEFRIAENLIGGWNHAAGLMIEHGAMHWPLLADPNRPVTWAPIYFGSNPPPPSNLLPVAEAGAAQTVSLSSAHTLYLDGSASFDPDGSPLTFNWTQVSGPSVLLQQSSTASPSFVVSPMDSPTTFTFQLIVNDGMASSAADQVQITVLPPPRRQPAVQRDAVSGAISGTTDWPGSTGDLYVIEASQDLRQWVPIQTNVVSFDGRVHFRDPDASRYPHRFYRARGVAATEQYGIGIHFGADDPPPAGSALASADVAGVVPQAHWNNLNGPRGSASSIVADLNGAAVSTTVSVEWGSPNTWSSTGRGEENNGFPPGGGDRLLMTGYLDTDNGPGIATVAVFGIDPIIASGGYDVIVYILGGVSGRGGAYTIGGVTKYGTAAANPATHIEDPGVGLADTGTYLRFTGLTGSSFMLIADANSANGPNRNFRAPINGIQVVPNGQ
jgi:hypothetical protein